MLEEYNVKEIAAKKKQPTVWKLADIGIDASEVGASGRRTKQVRLYQSACEGECEIIGGESPEEPGATLALKVRDAKIL